MMTKASIDAMMGSPRPRWAPSDVQRAILEESYTEVSSFPDLGRRHLLASELGIETRQVQVWFQNRRQKAKKKSGLESMNITEPDDYRGEPSKALAAPPFSDRMSVQQPNFAFRKLVHQTDHSQCVPKTVLDSPPFKRHDPSEALSRDLSNQIIGHLLARHADEKAQRFKKPHRLGIVSHPLPSAPNPRPLAPQSKFHPYPL